MALALPILLGLSAGAAVGGIMSKPKAPQLQAPNALSATPTQAQAATKATKTQLAQEQAASSTGTLLTGGAGLLTQPTTTSKVLIGS